MDKIRNLAIIDSKFPLPSGEIESLRISSNEYSVENISKSFHKMRTSSTQIATPNQEIEFTITLENTSEFEIFDIKIHDILPKELVFIEGSVKIDGVSYPNLDPISGFILPHALPPFSKIIITYSAKLAEMPIGREANSMSKITFSVDKMRDVTENSNETTIKAVQNLIEIVKTADKTIAKHNDIIKFTNTITNRGTELENIAIPHGTSAYMGPIAVLTDIIIEGPSNIDFKKAGISAAIGALEGGLSAAGLPVGVLVATNAALSAGESVYSDLTDNACKETNYSGWDIAAHAAISAGVSALFTAVGGASNGRELSAMHKSSSAAKKALGAKGLNPAVKKNLGNTISAYSKSLGKFGKDCLVDAVISTPFSTFSSKYATAGYDNVFGG